MEATTIFFVFKFIGMSANIEEKKAQELLTILNY